MRFVKQTPLIAALSLLVFVVGTSRAQDTAVGNTGYSSAQELPKLPSPNENQKRNSGQDRSNQQPESFSDIVIMNSRSFGIPFNVDSAENRPIEVQLLVCRGDSEWKMLDRQPPHMQKFMFEGKEDGVFWFATRTVDATGKTHPDGLVRPQLKVYIDTTEPELQLIAEADASGRVTTSVAWGDATPIKKAKLFYATDIKRDWTPVNTPVKANQEFSFIPNQAWQQLLLQVVATDAAGNTATRKRMLHRPRIATQSPRLATNEPAIEESESHVVPQPAAGDAVKQQFIQAISGPTKPEARVAQNVNLPSKLPAYRTQPTAQNALQGNAPTGNALPLRGAPPAANAGLQQVFQPQPQSPTQSVLVTPNPAQQNIPASTPVVPYPTNPLPQNPVPSPAMTAPPSLAASPAATPAIPTQLPATTPQLPPAATPAQITNGFSLDAPGQQPPTSLTAKAEQPPRTAAEAMRPITEKSAQKPKTKSADQSKSAQPLESDYAAKRISDPTYDRALFSGRVPVRYSDSERFSLDYELEAVGGNGAKAVELYGTLTRGNSWVMWGADPDQISPFDIETKGEGVFGFRIVVVGNNGLASPRPLAGEAPDIVVVVDKTEPKVKITSARYGEGDRTGSLIIGYEVTDSNLKSRPVSLSFSETPDGPWTTIAAGLTNEQFYVWPADPHMPKLIYLRLDATDRAGNVGTYVLDQPIETQGLAPRARIRGFRSLSGNEARTDDEQTANLPKASFK